MKFNILVMLFFLIGCSKNNNKNEALEQHVYNFNYIDGRYCSNTCLKVIVNKKNVSINLFENNIDGCLGIFFLKLKNNVQNNNYLDFVDEYESDNCNIFYNDIYIEKMGENQLDNSIYIKGISFSNKE